MLHPTGIEQGDADNPAVMQRLRAARERAEEHLRMIVGSNVNVATGTDSMHGLMSFEAECLVRWGMSNQQALQTITRRNAECCRVESTVSTHEAGKFADIISIKRNPLVDITALNDVGLIMKHRERYDELSER
jgi:imidazolonepropionase-like amidohydrolase